MDYSLKEDLELIELAKKGDNYALLTLFERYKGLVRATCHSLFLVGGDSEDLIQEGMIGLLKAISTYNGKSSFKSYSYLCIKRSVLSAIKVSNAKKNLPLNDYISLTSFCDESNDKREIMIDKQVDPETDLINKENLNELKISIKKVLSDFEYEILSMYLSGSSIDEIGKNINKNQKSTNNALHRIRKKLSNLVNK